MDKMIQDAAGDVTITNDGATILKQMSVLHPVARMVCVCSLAGQPLHKRGRVWYHAYTRVVPVLMQHLRLRGGHETALVKI